MKSKTISYMTGVVTFTGMWNPIFMTTPEGDEVNISDMIYEFMEKNNMQPAKVVCDRNSFTLKMMESDRVLNILREFDDKGELKRFGIGIEVPDGGWGWTNTQLQLEGLFISLVGRNAILEMEDDTLTVKLDEFNDDVPTVYYDKGNNAVLVGNYKVKDVCKPGTNDCCIFLTASADGFGCSKFNGPTSRVLMNRHAKGEMNATRIGNCKCGGRWEGLGESLKKKEEALKEEE